MRIERIRVDAFGRLRGLDTGPEALGDLVVVLGPNEAGKSTLFSFLTTALYGFSPATRERNPHVPWGADEAAGSVALTVADGCVEVERRLRSSPTGRMTRAGVSKELRNLPVPWVEHVPRLVFRQVFAVTLADLAGLDEETWARIQDRIVGSMGSSDLRPARVVADDLEREASEIWRPNRRGNQRLRDLQEELRALRGRRQQALERDREIRALVEERENVRVRLREVREEREGHRMALERVQTLRPLRIQLERIDGLRAKGGRREELRGVPDQPRAVLADTSDELARHRRRLASLDVQIAEADAAVAALDDTARRTLDHAADIGAFLAESAEAAGDRRRVGEADARLAELGVQIEASAVHLFDAGWREPLSDPVSALSVALLRDRVERLRSARARGAPEPRPAATRRRVPTRRARLGASILVAAVGATLLAWSAAGGPAWGLAVGAALLTLGLVGLATSPPRSPAERVTPGGSDERVVERLAAEVAHMLRELPVRPEYLDAPGEPLLAGIERLRGLLAERRQVRAARESARLRTDDVDARAAALLRALERPGDASATALAPALDRELRDAERARDVAERAARERERLGREREEVARDEARLTARIEELERTLAALGGGDVRRGAEVAQARVHAHARADQLVDELERSHADLEDLRRRIAAAGEGSDDSAVDDRDVARRKAHVEELEATVESLIARGEALDRDVAHLRELETVGAVDGEVATLQGREEALVRERDRKWVLAQLVREADRRFREEHQPDLLRRASAHLEHLTAGRYDRLLVDESGPDGLFQIVGPGLPAPVPLSAPVSTGTLEQAYLGLRLAIVDHLDQGHEPLPLFIDEAFVNWDPVRRSRGLEVVVDLASSRQLFVFTCHPETAERLAERGARVLRLGQAEG